MIPAPAATVLRALMLGDTHETRLPNCGEGLRWLRDRGYLHEADWLPAPRLSEAGAKLARSMRMGDT